ncbi:segregation/condensation protein A [Streptomyces sp. NPDC006743]|uniref:segregation and condensation protein A n=1 Tax=Streptomyces sp. NPDC006743 TaxID=3154480 RepID=UPI0034525D16
MTSNDVPPAGPGPAARRRALGRGPGTNAPLPEPAPPAAPAPPTAPDAPPVPVVTPDPAGPVPPARRPAPEARAEPEAPAKPAAPAGAGVAPAEPAGPPDERAPRRGGPGSPVGADGAAGADGTGGADGTAVAEGAPGAGGAEGADDTAGTEGAGGIHGADGAGGAGGADGGASAGTAASDDGVFKVRLANFEGPFDLLLQLISRHKLDVTEIALSKVTDEFMAHLRAMGPDGDLDRTTEFLVVAATLLDLKAARLLPAAEVEDEADLALLEARDLLFARLLQYRAYKQIADIFNGRLDEEARRHPRTVGLEPHHAELLPEVVISIGPEGFARLAVKAMQPKPKPQVYVDHIHAPLVSVQEQAGIVVARLRELGEASFRALVEDTDDTLTVVARFLALLELYREKAVALDQETALGDLLVRWTGGDGDARTMVTDEFDRPREAPAEPGADDPAADGPGPAGPGQDEPGMSEPRGEEEEKA